MRSDTIVLRNLLHNKARVALLCVAVASSFLLFGLLASLQFGASDQNSSSGDRLIVANKINFTQPLPISYFDQIAAIDGVQAATHSTWFGGYYREPSNFIVSLAVDFPTFFGVFDELNIADADLQKCMSTRDGIAVGQTMASALGWKRGDRIGLNSSIFTRKDGNSTWEFEICGIFSDSQERGADNAVYFGYEYLNEARNINSDMIGLITLRTGDVARNDAIIRAIDARYVNSPAETETITEQQFAAAFARQFGDLKLIIGLIVGCAFLTSLIVVGTTMATVIRSRFRDIGILKTLGFGNGSIVRLLLGETLSVALIGGVIGLGLAQLILLVAGQYVELGGIRMNLEIWSIGLLIAAAFGIVTAIAPAVTAFRLPIIDALGRQ